MSVLFSYTDTDGDRLDVDDLAIRLAFQAHEVDGSFHAVHLGRTGVDELYEKLGEWLGREEKQVVEPTSANSVTRTAALAAAKEVVDRPTVDNLIRVAQYILTGEDPL